MIKIKENLFVIIGAQRSGTTYLFQLLEEHPEIAMVKPLKPEPKIFLETNNIREIDSFFFKKFSDEILDDSKIFGLKATSYYENPEVAENISNYSSSAKILLILRNPVERAISNYYFSFENGLEKRSIEDVFLLNLPIKVKASTSVSPFDYYKRGLYSKFIPPFFKIFKQNMKIIIFENLKNNEEEIKKVYEFLGVNPSFTPQSLKEKINFSNRIEKFDPNIRNLLKEKYSAEISRLELMLDKNLKIWKK